tara:strand:+ start:2741 stop:3556 length:816 start_codon:yes stop_codon:yes gene_type:complete
MKTTYVYFGQKGYHYESDGTADQFINGDTATVLTKAASGLVPVDHTAGTANTSTSTDVYRIIIKSDGTESSAEMGSAYDTFFIDDEGVRNSQSGFVATKPQAGNAIALNAGGWGVASSGQITVIAYGTDGTNGYDIQADDKVWVEQIVAGDAAGNGYGGVGGMMAYPMSKFLGANPVAYAGEHWDGTALDQTDLHFEDSDGTGSDDIIRIIHTAGKYPEIVKTMEAIDNCGVYNRAVTFYDLDINGTETFAGGPSLSSNNDLGIVGLWRTT